ncbi:hypothetical protein ACIP5Y_27360 [Nocardia sp. NPDC088792]|uniref:hypothetical protein n=1 Tax=Nocardia sp. NPDC088792 TaxID=3364332 RepID=UPI0037F772B2
MTDTPQGPPAKAVIFLYRPLVATKARLDWAEFYARQRAAEQNLRIGQVIVADHIETGIQKLHSALRQMESQKGAVRSSRGGAGLRLFG